MKARTVEIRKGEQNIRELRRGGKGICLHEGLPPGTWLRYDTSTRNGIQLVILPPIPPLVERVENAVQH